MKVKLKNHYKSSRAKKLPFLKVIKQNKTELVKILKTLYK